MECVNAKNEVSRCHNNIFVQSMWTGFFFQDNPLDFYSNAISLLHAHHSVYCRVRLT